jgi:hypothetical protein
MTNKERNRYQELQKEIEILDAKIQTKKEEMVKANSLQLADLQNQLDVFEKKMEILFTEWADLEAKL